MNNLKLTYSEYKFMKIIWENQPLSSSNLVILCNQSLGWKKSTTYTVLKKLSEKSFVKNENSVITRIVSSNEYAKLESNTVVDKNFNGSLPKFVAAFMDGKKLSKKDADRLRKIIDKYEE